MSFALIRKTYAALGRAEKLLVLFLMVIFMISSSKLAYNVWQKNTVLAPAKGGTLTEGVIGNPRFINPILLQQSNNTDADLVRLIFSSLFAADQNGEIKPDAAESYELLEDKKTYIIKIKNNIFWQDSDSVESEIDKHLTADDVLFTIKAIQNPDYQSPLRGNLSGVETEKIDDYTIKLSLKIPYEPFLQNLTFGILPSHIWKNIDSTNAPRAASNTKPIGSGPYIFKQVATGTQGGIASIELSANDKYYNEGPFIETIIFKFFNDQNSLAGALANNQIDSTASLNTDDEDGISGLNIKKYTLKTPGYFAVFFNADQSRIFAEKNVRLALNYLTDKDRLVEKLLKNNGQKIETPVPPTLKGYSDQTNIYKFDPSYANTILTNSGWIPGEDGVRRKEFTKDIVPAPGSKTKTEIEKVPLEFTLATANTPELKKTAEALKEQWEQSGIKVNIALLNATERDSAIKNKDYDALLFGEILNFTPDPFIFWHSSGIKDSGSNLALYRNKDVDKMLEDLRQSYDPAQQADLLAKFQTQVVADAPAVFLYTRYTNYWMRADLKGIETKITTIPADRFAGIAGWSLVKKRVWDGKFKFLNF